MLYPLTLDELTSIVTKEEHGICSGLITFFVCVDASNWNLAVRTKWWPKKLIFWTTVLKLHSKVYVESLLLEKWTKTSNIHKQPSVPAFASVVHLYSSVVSGFVAYAASRSCVFCIYTEANRPNNVDTLKSTHRCTSIILWLLPYFSHGCSNVWPKLVLFCRSFFN